MQDNDQTSEEKTLISNIRKGLKKKFDLDSELIGEGKIGIEEFNGYIVSDDKYKDTEELAETLCEWVIERFNTYCDYSLIDMGYEIVIEVI